MSKRKSVVREEHLTEVHRLKGKRTGATLKEEVWFKDGVVTDYNLAYVNRSRSKRDHGRILGYDNSHGYHHRHFMGAVSAIEFVSYADLVEKFYAEVHELWRQEDEEE